MPAEAVRTILKSTLDSRSLAHIVKPMLNHRAVDRVFHALGDPTRRAIVERLSRSPASVSDLAKPFDISLAAVVQHLQVLEESGVVRTEKIGRVRSCHIQPEGLRLVERWIADRRTGWERYFDRLEALFDDEPSATPASRRKDK
jgi:DNA-binding transcriptional ArsR family regulator